MTNFIVPIDVGGGSQIFLTDTIRQRKMNLSEEVKIRLQCTSVYKREDDDQVYDYR